MTHVMTPPLCRDHLARAKSGSLELRAESTIHLIDHFRVTCLSIDPSSTTCANGFGALMLSCSQAPVFPVGLATFSANQCHLEAS